MKVGKLLAMILTVSMVVPLCACKPKNESESESSTRESSKITTKESSATASTSSSTETEPSVEPTVPSEVKDESEEPLVVYGYVKDFKKSISAYFPDTQIDYVFIEPKDYFTALSEALQNGEKKPDVFMMDKDHLQDYSNGNKTLGIEEVGIGLEELSDQFEYTYKASIGAGGAVKALSYDLAPSAVIYNRALAKTHLGSAEPSDVSAKVADWDSILELARSVNINTAGTVKLMADRQQIHNLFWAAHTSSWVKDKKIAVGSDLEKYFLIQESLHAESLTGEKTVGSEEWSQYINAGQAVLFFGSLKTAASVIGYVPGHKEDVKKETRPTETSTDGTSETTEEIPETGWSIVPAPTATYDGGTWLMVAYTCDKKATAGQFLRTLTMDKTVMTDLAVKGYFVNSRSIMAQCAADPNFACDFLGGQNPFAILVPEAEKIQIADDPDVNRCAENEIRKLLSAYLAGDIETFAEVKEQFIVGMEELLGLA